VAYDIYDYGKVPGVLVVDYLTTPQLRAVDGVVTNPPYRLAQAFAQKALSEAPYAALFVRTNFLMDAERRGKWLDLHEPTRVWMSAQRLPLMHRHGWTGNRSTSNTPYCWCIWERGAEREFPRRFYWKELLGQDSPVRSRRTVA